MIMGNDTEMLLLLKGLQYVTLSQQLGDEKIGVVYWKVGGIFLWQKHLARKSLANN